MGNPGSVPHRMLRFRWNVAFPLEMSGNGAELREAQKLLVFTCFSAHLAGIGELFLVLTLKNLLEEPSRGAFSRSLPEEPSRGAFSRSLPKEPSRGAFPRSLLEEPSQGAFSRSLPKEPSRGAFPRSPLEEPSHKIGHGFFFVSRIGSRPI